ncbi:MAG: exosortase/archaeosortase family protein [Victivallales bacterium]|nr:exosortase/archaeosortase family protein [Victivallales bacterium]
MHDYQTVIASAKKFIHDRERFYPSLVMSAVAIGFLVHLIVSGDSAGAYVLWLLAGCMTFFAIRETRPKPWKFDTVFAWGGLAVALAAAFLLPANAGNWALWIGVFALCVYCGGISMGVRLLLPALILCVVVPSSEFLYILLSFPLSKFCALLTVGTLRLFGVVATVDQAVIYIGMNRIAVTAACSGIELLEAMLLLGWLVVHFSHNKLTVRLLHYITLIPIIIFANTLRLTTVILLSFAIGEKAFGNGIHTALGYAVVILSIFLLLGVGKIFRSREGAVK